MTDLLLLTRYSFFYILDGGIAIGTLAIVGKFS